MQIKEVLAKVFTRREDAERPAPQLYIDRTHLRLEALNLAVEATKGTNFDHDETLTVAKGFANYLLYGEDRNQEV